MTILYRISSPPRITVILAKGVEVDEESYNPVEFERKWTNEDTNRKMMEEFDRLAWQNYKELAPGQKNWPGQNHRLRHHQASCRSIGMLLERTSP